MEHSIVFMTKTASSYRVGEGVTVFLWQRKKVNANITQFEPVSVNNK